MLQLDKRQQYEPIITLQLDKKPQYEQLIMLQLDNRQQYEQLIDFRLLLILMYENITPLFSFVWYYFFTTSYTLFSHNYL